MSQTPPLIPSATTVLLSPSDEGFSLLLLKRNSKIATHGGSWVFPGGKCDLEDCEHERELENFDALPKERQVEIAKQAACREAMEEAAIKPDKTALYLCSNWITPASMPKRFNTYFFIGMHASRDVEVDQQEICDYCWFTPEEALSLQENGELRLPPPTFVTLLQLAEHRDIESAIKALSKEPKTYRPKLVMTNKGFHSIYEEDSGYLKGQLELIPPIHRLIFNENKFEYLNKL